MVRIPFVSLLILCASSVFAQSQADRAALRARAEQQISQVKSDYEVALSYLAEVQKKGDSAQIECVKDTYLSFKSIMSIVQKSKDKLDASANDESDAGKKTFELESGRIAVAADQSSALRLSLESCVEGEIKVQEGGETKQEKDPNSRERSDDPSDEIVPIYEELEFEHPTPISGSK